MQYLGEGARPAAYVLDRAACSAQARATQCGTGVGVRRLGRLLCLTLAGWATSPAVVAEPEPGHELPAESLERGQQLYAAGARAQSAGRLSQALVLFSDAFRTYPGYDVAVALARVELKLERYAQAAMHLRYALARVPVTAGKATRQGLQQDFSACKARAARLVVRVLPDTARVLIDGVSLERDTFLSPGKYELRAELKGYASEARELELVAGQVAELELLLSPSEGGGVIVGEASAGARSEVDPELQRDESADPADRLKASGGSLQPKSHAASYERHRPAVLWVGGGLSLALLGLAGGFSVLSQTAADEVGAYRAENPNVDCGGTDDRLFCTELRALAAKQDSRDTLAKVMWVGFGVSAVTTTLTYLLWTEMVSEPPPMAVGMTSESLYVQLNYAF